VNYRFSVLAVNIGTQPKRHYSVSRLYFSSNTSFHKRDATAHPLQKGKCLTERKIQKSP